MAGDRLGESGVPYCLSAGPGPVGGTGQPQPGERPRHDLEDEAEGVARYVEQRRPAPGGQRPTDRELNARTGGCDKNSGHSSEGKRSSICYHASRENLDAQVASSLIRVRCRIADCHARARSAATMML